MNGAAILGTVLGSLAGKATDPVTWIVMIRALAIGVGRCAWWWVLIVAGVGAAVVAYVVSGYAGQLGIQFNAAQEWFQQWILIAAWALLVYGLVRLARRSPQQPGRGP